MGCDGGTEAGVANKVHSKMPRAQMSDNGVGGVQEVASRNSGGSAAGVVVNEASRG